MGMTGRWVLGGSGVATALLGVLLLARPDWGTTVFYTVLGVYLALMGATNLWDGLRRQRHPSRNRLLLGGALSLLAGIAAIANPMIALAVFPGVLLIVAGVLAILFGVVQMSQFRVRDQDGQAHTQWGRAAVGAAAVGLGVLVIANPVASSLVVVRAIGVALMAIGVLLLVLFGYLQRSRAV
ncbi:MAG: hypothetical protein F4Y08_00690 [Caldilineaceae bacterium SB0662_bin_9]|uniref:DUF308 domain-containing protein n=1 Tax=Caldilineaceae bacterium SB0662_bin_9 TaxID=2605258 RepID=A0A6B1DPY3_9CHLR|nr:hypothetical protein [Caldilineaceae bacterium SB0662_bin_9]